MMRLGIIVLFMCTGLLPLLAQQTPRHQAMQLSAAVQAAPPRITLSWPDDEDLGISYTVWRRALHDAWWGLPLATLAGHARSYVDNDVTPGTIYEYRMEKMISERQRSYGYLWSGIAVPVQEHRGMVILLVDTTTAQEMPEELHRLQRDLIGDGWGVIRHDVSPTEQPVVIRRMLQDDFFSAQRDVQAVLLFGRVPIVKSGFISPDGHAPRPFPNDAFYADLDGVWTDVAERVDGNVRVFTPNDGKYDQGQILTPPELACGRVWLADLPAFNTAYEGHEFVPKDETALLRQYLEKNHRFRHALLQPERRILSDDAWWRNKRPLMTDAWRATAPLLGADRIFERAWRKELTVNSYLWAWGGGGGSYNRASGVTDIAGLAQDDPQVVFTMLYGSYFCEWDRRDNLLRGVLATTSMGLTSQWAISPFLRLFPMAMGETIGYANRLTQRDDGREYAAESTAQILRPMISLALMGDPTLRMFIVPPPGAATARPLPDGQISVHWEASADADVLGYHLYRAAGETGKYQRLNTTLLAATDYRDAAPLPGVNYYMVRAVKLEISGSGSFYNASQGVFASAGMPRRATQPDLLVKNLRDALYRGEHLYDDTQQCGQVILTGETSTFLLRVVNDGTEEDAITVSAPMPDPHWGVKFYDAHVDGVEISPELLEAGWTVTLAAGAGQEFRAEVTMTEATNRALQLAVRARSAGEGVDAVTLQALPMDPCQPDVSIRVPGEDLAVGAGRFSSDGQQALLENTLEMGSTIVYAVNVRNTGSRTGEFMLSRETFGDERAMPKSFTIKIFDQLQGGDEVTRQLAGGFPFTLEAGASRDFRLEVSGTLVRTEELLETALNLQLCAASLGIVNRLDAVRVSTILGGTISPYQPDLAIAMSARKPEHNPFQFQSQVYQNDVRQSMQCTLAGGGERSYHLTVINSGVGEKSDRITVKASGDLIGWDMRFFDAPQGGNDITALMTGAGWTVELAPDGYHDFRVEMTASDDAPRDVEQTVFITANSAGDIEKSDRVVLKLTRSIPLAADLQVRLPVDEHYPTSREIAEVTQTVTAGSTVVFFVKSLNDSDRPYALRLHGFTPDKEEGWRVRIFDALNGGEDVTALVRRGLYIVPDMAPGDSREMRVEITADAGVEAGTRWNFILIASPHQVAVMKGDVMTLTVVSDKP